MMFGKFTDQLVNDVIDFKNYWLNEGATNPKQFPRYLENGSAEWYEQFFAYLEMKNRKESN